MSQIILLQEDNDGSPVRFTYDDTPNLGFPYRLEQFQDKSRHIPHDTIWLSKETVLKLKEALEND